MPLRRALGQPRPEKDSMVFPMQDTRTGCVVMGRITEGALRELTGSATHNTQVMFEACRQQAEELASAKYDRQRGTALVTRQDVVRARKRAGPSATAP
jgi:hypothetical protein